MATKSAPPAAYYAHKPISCNACRKRKLKCDRVKPCSSCVLRGIEGSCYQDDEAGHAQAATSTAARRTEAGSSSRRSEAPTVDDGSAHGDTNEYGGGRGTKRARPSAQQANPAGAITTTSLRRYADTPSAASSGDAVNLIRDVLENLQREQQRLEDALAAVQQPQRSSPQLSADPTKEGAFSQETITLDDLGSLPSLEASESLLSYYVNELSVYTDFIAPGDLFAIWHRLVDGHAVSANNASHVVIAIATAANMLPRAHPLQESTEHGGKVEAWSRLAENLAHQTYRQSQVLRARQFQASRVDGDLLDVLKGAAMFMLYYAMSGQADHLWISTGYTVRRGVCYGLFDQRHGMWKSLSAEEYSNRLKLARRILYLDRWQALARASPFAIHPLQVHLNSSSNDPLALQIGMLEDASDFLDRYDTKNAERFREALGLDARQEHKMRQGLAFFSQNEDKAISSAQSNLSPYFENLARPDVPINVREFIWMVEIAFLRCMSMRRFLLDEEAPLTLRYRSLEHAQCILTVAPTLSRLIFERGFPVSITSHGHHLLCALTAFDVVISGAEDVYSRFLGIDSGMPLSHAASSSPKAQPSGAPRAANGVEMPSSRAHDWQLERRLPPLLPAGMMRASLGPHGDNSTYVSTSPGHMSTGFAESGSRHTQQQPHQQAVIAGRRRSLEQIQWLEMHLPSIYDFLRLIEQHGVLNGESGHELLQWLLEVTGRLKKTIAPNAGERVPYSPASSPTTWSSERPALVSPALRAGQQGAQGPRFGGQDAQSMRSGPPPPPPSYFASHGSGGPNTSLRSPISPREDEQRAAYAAGDRANSDAGTHDVGQGTSSGASATEQGSTSSYGRPHLQPFQTLYHQGQQTHRNVRHDEAGAGTRHSLVSQPDTRHVYTSSVPYNYAQAPQHRHEPPSLRPFQAPLSQPRPPSHQHPSPPSR